MSHNEHTVKRIKEIIFNYQKMKKKMRGKSINASRRTLIQRFKHEALEELETLITRL